MLPCRNNLHQEDVESKSKINFKSREKQPKFEVDFKILIHYFSCYLRAIVIFFLNLLGMGFSVWLLVGTQQIYVNCMPDAFLSSIG